MFQIISGTRDTFPNSTPFDTASDTGGLGPSLLTGQPAHTGGRFAKPEDETS